MTDQPKKRKFEESKINSLNDLVLALYDIEAFKVGKFQLKSGISSPFYIDLRVIVSYPHVLQGVADQMWKLVENFPFDVVCGVPYTALPVATVLSLQHNRPMVMRRKEPKSYGTGKTIEGSFKKGNICLVVEDLVTSGASVFETVEPLTECGLVVKDVVVLVDREQGGRQNLTGKGLKLHSVLKLTDFLKILQDNGRISESVTNEVHAFIAENQLNETKKEQDGKEKKSESKKKLSYVDRIPLSRNPIAKRLLKIMNDKKTNLCLSADVTTTAQLLKLADELGPSICCLKTHIDIIEDFTEQTYVELQKLAKKHNFLIFEDRKFADIGNTVSLQFSKGVYKISSWADIVNAHIVPGPGVIQGLRDGGLSKQGGLLLLAEMSSEGSMAKGAYTDKCVELAKQYAEFVVGFVAQRQLTAEGDFLHFTPGVKLAAGGDGLGQQYDTPRSAIFERNSDIIIVGRGIIESTSPLKTSQEYQKAGWEAYIERLTS